MRERIRYCHYSARTEQAYLFWVRRFIRLALGLHKAFNDRTVALVHILEPKAREQKMV
jgi:hypothetical protein